MPSSLSVADRISPMWALVIAAVAVGVYIVVGFLPEVTRDLHEPNAIVAAHSERPRRDVVDSIESVDPVVVA